MATSSDENAGNTKQVDPRDSSDTDGELDDLLAELEAQNSPTMHSKMTTKAMSPETIPPAIPLEIRTPVTASDITTTVTNTSNVPKKKNAKRKRSCSVSEDDRHKKNKRLCALHNFPRPMPPNKFKTFAWRLTKTFERKLQPGHIFKTPQELASIPRSYNDPFCWPGPLVHKETGKESYWHLADSIVQEVKIKSQESSFYVVRWRGYEDEYNTVEPLDNLKETAVLELFKKPKLYTACGISGCVIRRSGGEIQERVPVQLPKEIPQTNYELAMGSLMAELSIEEKAGRFNPLLGFCSYDDIITALIAQHKFVFEKFVPIVKRFGSGVHVDQHYLGIFCGNLSRVAAFQDIAKRQATKANPIKDYINRGLSASKSTASGNGQHFVSFFAPRKFGTGEKKGQAHLKFHMAVFTVRSLGNVKDAIYFDPSPFNRDIPTLIQNIKAPKFTNFTTESGVASGKNDCMVQCMKYVIGLATGHTTFEPDLSRPARKIDKLLREKAERKRLNVTMAKAGTFVFKFANQAYKILRNVAAGTAGVITLYRTIDSISRLPDHIEKLKAYLLSKKPDEQAAPLENVNRQRDWVNPSSEQCVSADLIRIKEFMEAARFAKVKK